MARMGSFVSALARFAQDDGKEVAQPGTPECKLPHRRTAAPTVTQGHYAFVHDR